MLNHDNPVTLVQGVVDPKLFDDLKSKGLKEVFVLEGRPTLEAARTSSKELLKRGMTPTIISDNMAGVLFYKNLVAEAWIASQYSDSEGAACDIGGLILAVLGKKHGIPVRTYPAGRKTSFLGRSQDLVSFLKKRIAPKGIEAFVPLVEWVPAQYLNRIPAVVVAKVNA